MYEVLLSQSCFGAHERSRVNEVTIVGLLRDQALSCRDQPDVTELMYDGTIG